MLLRLAHRFLRFTNAHDRLILYFNRQNKLHFWLENRLGPSAPQNGGQDCSSQRAPRRRHLGAETSFPRRRGGGGGDVRHLTAPSSLVRRD